MSLYTTGQVARLAGVTVRTVQYYDQRGILCPSEWTEGGRRLYTEEDLIRLRMICYLRELDFSIPQIKDLLEQEHAEKTLATLLETHIHSLEKGLKSQEDKLKQLYFLRKTLHSNATITLHQLPDISLTMKENLRWRQFALKQYMKLFLVLVLFLSLIWLAKSKSMNWLGLPATIGYLGSLGYLIWNYYQQILYLCPLCQKTFKPSYKAFLFSQHTPRTRKLTCPHCQHKSWCVEVVQEA